MPIDKRQLFLYLVKFIGSFCLLYGGTQVIIGITAPGGYYWNFAKQHLDYIAAFRILLLKTSKAMLTILGYETYLKDGYTIRNINGIGVHLVYSCLGFGVMSFWTAFIYANKGKFLVKTAWILAGLLMIFAINVSRVCLMLIGIKNGWKLPFDLDNHFAFNAAVYIVIFFMIVLFDKSGRKATS